MALIVLLAPSSLFSQSNQKNGPGGLIVVSSADAPGKLSAHRLTSCLRQLIRRWKQDERNLPTIVVFHVSRRNAKMANVGTHTGVRRNHAADSSDLYYEIWFVDKATVDQYVLALENVVEDHYHLSPTDEERKEAMTFTARVMNDTISVPEGE
jgi:hypothetical protein